MNRVEWEIINEIVESVAERHQGEKAAASIGDALAWITGFERALRRVVAKYEKRLIVIPHPTVAVKSRPGSGLNSAQQPVGSKSRVAVQPDRVA